MGPYGAPLSSSPVWLLLRKSLAALLPRRGACSACSLREHAEHALEPNWWAPTGPPWVRRRRTLERLSRPCFLAPEGETNLRSACSAKLSKQSKRNCLSAHTSKVAFVMAGSNGPEGADRFALLARPRGEHPKRAAPRIQEQGLPACS